MKLKKDQPIEWYQDCITNMQATRAEYEQQIESLKDRRDRLTAEIEVYRVKVLKMQTK